MAELGLVWARWSTASSSRHRVVRSSASEVQGMLTMEPVRSTVARDTQKRPDGVGDGWLGEAG